MATYGGDSELNSCLCGVGLEDTVVVGKEGPMGPTRFPRQLKE